MTAFEQIVFDMANRLTDLSGGETTRDELAQRFACTIIQTRAQECRHLSSMLMIGAMDPSSGLGRPEMAPAAASFAKTLSDRSHHLEALAMEWARQWPPVDREAPGRLVLVQ